MKKKRALPYGYTIENGKRTVDETEAAVVRNIFRAYQNGASLSEIASTLTRKQVPYNESRTVWNKNIIARIIANPRYAGADGFDPIIDPDVFKTVNISRCDRSNWSSDQDNSTVGILRAKVLCGRCGGRMVRIHDHRNKIPVSWLCDCPECRSRVTLADDTLEKRIVARMNAIIDTPDLLASGETYRMDAEESIQRSKATSELSWMCESGHYSDAQLIGIILENAQKRYQQCPENLSKTISMITVAYSEAMQTEKLNAELFLKTVSNILLDPDGSMVLRLVSGNEI